MSCDLHTHSIYSDGTVSPAKILSEAKQIGLDAVALTDHNTIAGLPDFIDTAKKLDIIAIGGVELSTAYNDKEIHLLGLFVSPEHYNDVEGLAKEFHILKEISNIETIERLNDAGYLINYADVRHKNPTGNVNRAHIASELMAKGYVQSITEAFNTILSEAAGFYVPPARLQLIEAIRFLKEISALPIIAHPLKDLTEPNLRSLLPIAIDAGLRGIEVYHSSYDDSKIAASKIIASEFNLLQSGGSDFHGSNKPDIKLGFGKGNLKIPTDIFNKLLDAHYKN